MWRIRANPTKLVCAVGSRNGTEETKLLVLDFEDNTTLRPAAALEHLSSKDFCECEHNVDDDDVDGEDDDEDVEVEELSM